MTVESFRLPTDPPLTPCVGVCTMDSAGLCHGCRRTLAEIARWGGMDDDARRRWIREVQPSRPPPQS